MATISYVMYRMDTGEIYMKGIHNSDSIVAEVIRQCIITGTPLAALCNVQPRPGDWVDINAEPPVLIDHAPT